jgi:putative spermidine/putrescine transport system permease protein
MAELAHSAAPDAPALTRRAGFNWAWLGVAPFFLFALLFLILPTLDLILGAFRTPDGSFTLDNLRRLNQPTIVSAYRISIQVSLASALLGRDRGFFLASPS